VNTHYFLRLNLQCYTEKKYYSVIIPITLISNRLYFKKNKKVFIVYLNTLPAPPFSLSLSLSLSLYRDAVCVKINEGKSTSHYTTNIIGNDDKAI